MTRNTTSDPEGSAVTVGGDLAHGARGVPDHGRARKTTLDLAPGAERLFAEIEAYLAVVDAMRLEGIEPRWGSERHAPSRDRRASGDRDLSFPRLVWGC
jgi:hypothetical protein